MNWSTIWQFFVRVCSSTAGKIGIALAVAGALVCAFSLTSCSSMYALNNAIRYEYKLSRESEIHTQSSLLITNQSSFKNENN